MASVAEKFSISYNALFNDLADPRVKNWPFMSDPGLILILTVIYIFFVWSLGPAIMSRRKPFKLKEIIICYNTFQVIANSLVFYKVYTSGWSTTLTLGCEPVDYSDDPNAVSVFFVLRKKQNQVSFLHVYHHASTLCFTWVGTKYLGGGMSTFCVLLNSFIHVLMYTYYLLAALGSETLQKSISKWKKYLTTAQMIQFCIVVIHLMQALSPHCSMPKGIIAMFIPNVILVFGLFYNFFKKTYKKTQ